MCQHTTPCPTAVASDREAASTVARDDVLGWALLCNGVVLFDAGELLPEGQIIAPHHPTTLTGAAA